MEQHQMVLSHSRSYGKAVESHLVEKHLAILGHRVRGLRVEVHAGRLVLRGRTTSFHVKQLAQHAAMALTELPLEANEIEVVSGLRRRVLLAASDDQVRAAGRARLTELGWEVATAAHGLDCVAHLRRSVWDVIVLDANLLWGGADGVMSEIAEGALPELPIVFLGNPPSIPVSRIPARIVEVLEKPLDLDALARAAADAADGRETVLMEP
jgi:CheY-like chemotaxis protein